MFRSVKNKKFTDVITNNILTVNEQIENIALLDNGQRIDVNRLLNPMYFDEYIDPNAFFNNTSENMYNIFSQQVKSIPNEILEKLPQNDSLIISNYDIEDEKRMLADKYNIQNSSEQATNSAQRQLDLLKSIVGEEEYSNDELTKMMNVAPQKNIIINQSQDEVIRINVEDSEETKQEIVTSPMEKNKRDMYKEDPITTIFKNVKKNTDFSFTLEIFEKIPRLDFLEMMEDSYEVSIINFLAEEFVKKLMSEPNLIKDKIINEIKLLIENKDKVKKVSKTEDKTEDILPKTVKKIPVKRKIITEEKNKI
jgi:hypothetical protein